MKKFLLSLLAFIALGVSSSFAETVDLTRDMFHEWDDYKANANIVGAGGCDYQIGVSTGMPYGNGSVIGAQYADLSEYETLQLTVTDGAPRLLMNRPGLGGDQPGYIEINSPSSNYVKSTEGGVWVIDLAQIVADKGYAHLNVIKGANWANVTITEMKLTKSDAPAAPKCPKLLFDIPNSALVNLANTRSIHLDAVCPLGSNVEDDLFIEGTLSGKDGTNDHIANFTDFEDGADVSIARLTPGNSYTIIITKVAYGEVVDMDPETYMPIFENNFEDENGLASVDFTILSDGEIEVGTLAWVNEAQGFENRLGTMTDATVFGTDAGPSAEGKLSYFDITKYATLKVYGPAGQRARFFINRAEYAGGTFQFYVDINENGVGVLDLATVYAAQPGATYIHLNGIKANAWGQKLQLNGVTVCGEGVEMIASNLVITEAGWATYSAPFAVNIPEGVTAYIVKGVENDVLTLEEIEGTIPAWQPVVLEGPAMNVPLSGEDDINAEWPVGILLNMPYEDSYASVGDYVLQNHDGKVGFYVVEESETITVPAWKCFITSSGPGSIPGFDPLVKAFYFENATTAINKLTTADKKQIFDMNGRQINKLQKGINIVNGVKVLVK